ncbi:MAG: beta-ketoacyl-ACP synthase II [Christensenella sp.]|uniref:beta-ketoacyl-ACP synthase II n=1 Tax=Christensenella sp. TaxID=1935934 RepID=UPI002B21B002|nr:beta-ketoacyl-ACP synthase II [Christensenella sp.]MEA5002921.1 beta-ketoacyl-ACP synthase II [Christensenella sp.]
MARRVVVTGMGILSPNGNTVKEAWQNTKNGVNGIGPLTKAGAEGLPVHFAGQLKNLDVLDFLDKKDARRMDEYAQYGVIAGDQAMADAGFSEENNPYDPFRFGVLVGSGIGGLDTMEKEITKLNERGFKKVNPLLIPMMISNMASGHLAIRHKLQGYNTTVTTACASGSHSIGDAFRMIKDGYMDAMLAGGAESPVKMLAISGFIGLHAVTTADKLERASIPFDLERSGFVIGEGAGVLVLEEYEMAKARGAKIYAEIGGYGATCDAYHMTAPEPQGAALARAMRVALEEAHIKPSEVDYINAHGTSTDLNDRTETMCFKEVFGEDAYKVAISSTKSMTGHSLGAAGGIEAIYSIMAIQDGFIPPTINYQIPDPECDLDCTPNTGRETNVQVAMSDNLGFGGHNAALLFKKVD